MPEEPSQLRLALVEVYPVYVAAVLHERGIDVDEVVADAIIEGSQVLDGLLTTLDRTPFSDQRTSPLECFREALRPVGRALDIQGVEPSTGGQPSSLVWDHHGLAPGSSQVLGQRAHDEHMRWAITKAMALGPMVRGPGISVVARQEDAERIAEQADALGYRPSVDNPSVVVIDTDLDGGREAIADYALRDGRPSRIIAFSRSVDDLSTMALKALGADMVVPADRLLSHLDQYLPTLA